MSDEYEIGKSVGRLTVWLAMFDGSHDVAHLDGLIETATRLRTHLGAPEGTIAPGENAIVETTSGAPTNVRVEWDGRMMHSKASPWLLEDTSSPFRRGIVEGAFVPVGATVSCRDAKHRWQATVTCATHDGFQWVSSSNREEVGK